MPQYLYIVANDSMPGQLKVGHTKRLPSDRLRELQSTGVPTPFYFELVLIVANGSTAERAAHSALIRYRTRLNREFFRTTTRVAIPKILTAVGSYEIDWIYTPRNHDVPQIAAKFEKAKEETRRRNEPALNELQRNIAERDKTLAALAAKREQLGDVPPVYNGGWWILCFFIWFPLPIGFLLYMFVYSWLAKGKDEALGMWSLVILCLSLLGSYRDHKAETEYRALIKPFNFIDSDIQTVTSQRADLQTKLITLLKD